MLTLPRRVRPRHGGARGFSMALVALVLVGLLGIAGLVVDLGSWQVEASRVQQAADAAALAGVVRLHESDAAAISRAISVAADNGYDDADPTVTVKVTPLSQESLAVEITKTDVAQFFTRIFRGPGTITRRSTSQYIQPVPLGSPRNYLGTARLPIGVTGDGVENFYLAVSGECARREHGDRITPRAMSNPRPPNHRCDGNLENPEHDDRGYLFGVDVAQTGAALQMWDAPVCPSTSDGGLDLGEQADAFDVVVTVRRYNPLDPYDADVLFTRTYEGENSTTGLCQPGSASPADECQDGDHLRLCWHTLVPHLGPGQYTVQVDPVFEAPDRDEHHNAFALRAQHTSSWDPCTRDEARNGAPDGTGVDYDPACPLVYGLEHLPIWARGTSTPVFYLSSIDSRHAGKTLEVTLFDSAEGARSISLIDPGGQAVPFAWEILCANGRSAPAGGCSGEGEPAPPGRRGQSTLIDPGDGTPIHAVDVSGNVPDTQRTFLDNYQAGKYSDRLLRLTYKLPIDFEAAGYGENTWWKIRYGGQFTGDRTTWSVRLLGDPVRLVPNPTTTTAPAPAG